MEKLENLAQNFCKKKKSKYLTIRKYKYRKKIEYKI